jgi:hypothetical protein
MNPLIAIPLAEMHRQALLAEADNARLGRQARGAARPGFREAMRRLTVVLAVRAHVVHAGGD